MKHCTLFTLAFASCTGLLAPAAAAPTVVRRTADSNSVPSWTCVEPSDSGDATPVTLVNANAAFYSSNGGYDCDWLVSWDPSCGSLRKFPSDASMIIPREMVKVLVSLLLRVRRTRTLRHSNSSLRLRAILSAFWRLWVRESRFLVLPCP